MIQLRWVTRGRKVRVHWWWPWLHTTVAFNVLQYRWAVNPASEHELHGVVWSDWTDVPHEEEG